MAECVLGVDFGTSFTVAALAQNDGPRLVDVEGDGSNRLASAVWLDDDGNLIVGSAAAHQAVFAPDRFEPTPKRLLGDGDVILGDRLIPDTEVVAAVLRRVATEAARLADAPATRVVVTHPAEWGKARLDTLRSAAELAGLDRIDLVEEPVAAAIRIGASRLSPGQEVAIYDFGGGTFDVAVLRRTQDGFEVAGPPGGRDPLGGEDIDQRIVDHLGNGKLGQHADWSSLLAPPDVRWRRAAAGFRAEVRRAKEGLSGQLAWQLWVPGIEREVQLTRRELEELIEPDVELTLDVLDETVRAAGLEPTSLAGIYLVGGSSRIPMIADRIWARFGQQPSVQDDPKTVVALGAIAWRPRLATARPATASALEPTPTSSTFRSRIGMSTHPKFWTSGVECYGYLTLTDASGERATVADEPDPGGVESLAAARHETLAAQPGFADLGVTPTELFGMPGLERWYTTGPLAGQHVERYAVSGGRAFVASAGAGALSLLEAVSLAPRRLDASRFYQLPFAVHLHPGLEVHERVELIRHRSFHRVTAESYQLGAATTLEEWSARRAAAFTAIPAYRWLRQRDGRILGNPASISRLRLVDGLLAQVHTFQLADSPVPQQIKLWATVAGGRGYSVVAALPEAERFGFRLLAAHVVLAGEAPGTSPLKEHG